MTSRRPPRLADIVDEDDDELDTTDSDTDSDPTDDDDAIASRCPSLAMTDEDVIAIVMASAGYDPDRPERSPRILPRRSRRHNEGTAVRLDPDIVREATTLAIRMSRATGSAGWRNQSVSIDTMLRTAIAVYTRFADMRDIEAQRTRYAASARDIERARPPRYAPMPTASDAQSADPGDG